MEKNTKTRIQHKHDSAENWNKAINFVPLIGELIVYDADENYSYPRFKVGDGETTVVNLAFANEQNLSTQVQSDWNQGDINQPDFIKNKPFGPKPDLYNNSSLGFELDQKTRIYFTNVGEDVIVPIQVNDSVTVVWDSIPYEVTSKEITFTLENTGTPIMVKGYLGDPQLLAIYFGGSANIESTGEPFLIVQKLGLILTSRGNNHSVIVKNNNYISKIDPRYLPDEALQSPVQADWNETDETSFAYIKNKPPISSEGISTIQSDWKQTDDTQPDFIKNKPTTWYASNIIGLPKVGETGEYLDLKHRPFGEIDFLEERTSVFEKDTENETIYYRKIYNNFSLVEGEQYKITWDGTEYTRTCKRYGDSTLLYIGNFSLIFDILENTGEPFLVSEQSILTHDTSKEHTFSVIPINAIKKIDSKYLPDTDSSLPEITAADDGKVLGVVNGSPKWVEQNENISSDIIDIFPEQEITITLQDENGAHPYGWVNHDAAFVLTAGETYYVVWDGVEYSCVAFSGSGDLSGLVFIGNTKFTDGTEDTGEPFAFSYMLIKGDGITEAFNMCVTDDTEETTHIVHIYQGKKTIDLPSDFFVPEEKLTDVLPKEDLDFTHNSTFGEYKAVVFYNEEVYQKWESYNGMVRVVWDNVEYDVPMQHIDALSGVGDCTGLGGTGNNEPFIIGIIKEANGSVEGGYDYIMIIMSKTAEASHNVQVSYIGEIPKVNVNYLPPIEKEFLPDVTNEDNGKILTVSDGAWVAKQVQVEQVQSDWDEIDTTSPAYIKNKPVISGDGSASVQANWNQTDETQADFIKNKPFGSSGLESTELIPATDLPFEWFGNGEPYTFVTVPSSEQLAIWNSDWTSCDFTFDGTTYTCEPQQLGVAKGIGNIGLLLGAGDNGMPFIMGIADAATMGGDSDVCFIYSLVDSYTEILSSSQLSFTLVNGQTYYGSDVSTLSLIEGTTYKVNWNQNGYSNFTATLYTSNNETYIGLGNPSIMGLGDDTGDAFFVYMKAASDGTQSSSIVTTTEGTYNVEIIYAPNVTHNVSVSVNKEDIKYLDSKFIADVSWDKISDKPFYEISAEAVVLEETVIIGSFDEDLYESIAILNNLQASYIIAGGNYKVTIGETIYSAVSVFDESSGLVYIQCRDSNGGFMFDIIPNFLFGDVFVSNPNYFPNGSTYNVKVVLAEEVVKKIDEKYLPAEAVPVTIDLSGYESNGKIIETFADGSTETTIIEFDSTGRPSTITDKNGNVTTLTW